VRNDNTSSAAYVGSGNGTSPPELYTAYDPDNLGSYNPIQPGETALLQNLQTGMYCQLRSMPTNATQLGMFCDQPTPATATIMTYTGSGLTYDGIPLVASGPGAPLLLANTTAIAPGPRDDNLSFPPAGGIQTAAGMALSAQRPGMRGGPTMCSPLLSRQLCCCAHSLLGGQ
jgi:hypothetical protein